ncbi:MAG TPA: hypothetical protein VJX92_15525 [Methylomirabilota bacterium]|nr:hypothetical protein [Methylomirabilota bacterium]
MSQQVNRYDALRARLRTQQRRAAGPVTAVLQRVRAAIARQPVRTYGSRFRRP